MNAHCFKAIIFILEINQSLQITGLITKQIQKNQQQHNPKTLPLALGTDHLSLSTHLHSNHHPYVKGFPKIHETFVVRPIS